MHAVAVRPARTRAKSTAFPTEPLITVRSYEVSDYDGIQALYRQGHLYGGQFDEDRDSATRLQAQIREAPDSILVAIEDDHLVGTVSLIEDARVAFLFRFAVVDTPSASAAAKGLYDRAAAVLRSHGHNQVLVYSPVGNDSLDHRYEALGMAKGGDYSCFWTEL